MTFRRIGSRVLRKVFSSQMELRDLRREHQRKLAELQKNTELTHEQWVEKVKSQYKHATGHELNLENPKRFTEKIQWRKLYENDPRYSALADKYAVREYVREKIGEEYLIPLLGVWDSAEKIRFWKLPNSFVLKTNNASGTNIIVKDKQAIDKATVREVLSFWLRMPFWAKTGELHYKAITPRIIAEKNMLSENANDLLDYKFYCFSGKPVFCQIISDRFSEEHIDFYDMQWRHQDFIGLNPKCKNSPNRHKKPACFDEMKSVTERLSESFPFVRVDLYEVDGKPFFGEMTFTPASGNGVFSPDIWDYHLGELWKEDKQ